MDRRGFLQSILVAVVAPAIVRADSLMKIIPAERLVVVPEFGPLLLVPASFSVSHARMGFDEGRDIALSAMVNWMARDHARRKYGRFREIQVFEDRSHDAFQGITTVKARVQLLREVHQYHEE